jgi:hypothetical protein
VTEPSQNTSHAQQARRLLLRHVLKVLPEVVKDVSALLEKLPESGDSSEKIQFTETLRRTWLTLGLPWQRAAGQRLLGQAPGATSGSHLSSELRLLDEEDVELQILAGRLAQTLAAPAQDEFNDLRLRLQHLEQIEELAGNDAVQPVHLAQTTLGAWSEVGLTRDDWQHCKPVIEPRLASTFNEACHLANAWLLQQGVLPHIDLRALVRRGRDGALHHPTETAAPTPRNSAAATGGTPAAAMLQDMTQRMRKLLADHIPAAARWLGGAAPTSAAPPGPSTDTNAGTISGAGAGAGAAKHRADATTLMVAMPHPPTPGALRAADAGAIAPEAYQAGVAELRQQTRALKSAASSQQDKAVIEVVALIFDSILAEERLPPSIRVWFARLQMPVLRVALVDADFLGSTDHPARLLLDRMGACVMGFDAGVSLEPLEAEMRRVVQVVEQYPETGRKVFEIVYKEFEAFLSQHLLERGDTQKLVNLAEQVELKETLTVKFTIELRKLLGQAPVAEPVRDFLFHVWTEVLALATVRHGAQHDVSTGFRAVAGELLWMASAKPTRAERAKVIGRLPSLMAQLRDGMTLLGLAAKLQEQHIKRVSDALVEAFMARTQPLSDQWLQDMTQRLGSLDAYLADTEVEQIKLDQYSIEMITGVDASDIVVVPDTEQKVSAALRAWAKALERGAWFELSHNGFSSLVQLSWRSPQKQLFLFAGPERRSFLLQQGRVASYLEAGLLKPCEPETLTLRATRDALNKLDANPERLLA